MPILPGVGTEKVTGFKLQSKNPIDATRSWVADQTGRLDIEFPYYGLHTVQGDTGQIFRYIGDESDNLITDWELVPTFRSDTGTPDNSLGVIGDYYIDETASFLYKKTGASTWTLLFDLSGANIFTGTTVPDDGSLGANGDIYIRSDGGVYRKESDAWSLKFNIKGVDGQSDRYATTSSTSVNLDTVTAPLNMVVDTGLSYTAGQSVIVASRADIANNITATVSSYTTGTGAIILTNLTVNGTGTYTDWDVNLSGAEGRVGKGFIHTESDITLTESKISIIEGGSYTPQNPYNASVQVDSRSDKTIPTSLSGIMEYHSISYDGTNWYDNGVWRGPKGDNGEKGDQGEQGQQGVKGDDGIAIVRDYGTKNTNYTIPAESVAGFYELRIYITGNITLTLPSNNSLNGIHYRLVAVLANVSNVTFFPSDSAASNQIYHAGSFTASYTVSGNRTVTIISKPSTAAANTIWAISSVEPPIVNANLGYSKVFWNNYRMHSGSETNPVVNSRNFSINNSGVNTAQIYTTRSIAIEQPSKIRFELGTLFAGGAGSTDMGCAASLWVRPPGGAWIQIKRNFYLSDGDKDWKFITVKDVYYAWQVGTYQYYLRLDGRNTSDTGAINMKYCLDFEYEAMIVTI